MDQLSKVEKDFSKMADSSPPGLGDKVTEVRDRLKKVAKETEDRSVLSPQAIPP